MPGYRHGLPTALPIWFHITHPLSQECFSELTCILWTRRRWPNFGTLQIWNLLWPFDIQFVSIFMCVFHSQSRVLTCIKFAAQASPVLTQFTTISLSAWAPVLAEDLCNDHDTNIRWWRSDDDDEICHLALWDYRWIPLGNFRCLWLQWPPLEKLCIAFTWVQCNCIFLSAIQQSFIADADC